MKELTTEEKAQAYDEALEKAKEILEMTSDKSAIYTIFPELAESEDERVRKGIIELVKQSSEILNKKNQERMLDWLEKQKEYESTDFEYVWDRTDCGELTAALDKYSEEAIINMCHAWYDKGIELERKSWLEKQGQVKESTISQHEIETCKENNNSLTNEDERIRKDIKQYFLYLDDSFPDKAKWLTWLEKQAEHANFLSKIQVGDKVTRNENGVLVNLSQLKRVAKPREKQAEQKASYTTIVETGDGGINALVTRELPTDGEQKPAEQQMYWTEEEIEPIISDYLCGREHYGGMIGRLCHLKPKQKQTEWSENDKAFLDDILCKLEHDLILNKDEKEWFHSLQDRVQLQPKQEWSDEDEEHIDSLLKRLDALCRNKFERTRFAISEDREWLKSLRPQSRWKPSELQLGCLSDAIEHYNSLGYPATKLKELYEQLKKL